jgi:tetratricopeptide (TPR) repeat protein
LRLVKVIPAPRPAGGLWVRNIFDGISVKSHREVRGMADHKEKSSTIGERFRRGAAGILAGLVVLFAACTPNPSGLKIVTLDELLQGGREEGLAVANPFAVDPAIAAEVEVAVGSAGTPTDRMRRLTRYLNDRGFDYRANRSLTANEAFVARQGDCMAYTNLYLGLARNLRVPTFFVHISEARNYYEKDGLNFVSSHMAVGCALQQYTVIVDFTEQKSEYALALYDSVDDATAAGLFYNNVAVDHLLAGDMAYSERLLAYLLKALPHLKEAQNNLAVILMRQGRFPEALVVLQDALARHPEYQPLYTNAVQAAKGSGQSQLAKQLEAQGERFLKRDPFFIFNQGIALYEKKDFGGALAEFRKIISQQPMSAILFAWIARVELSAGRVKEGIQAFERAQSIAPFLPMLKTLRVEFPDLQIVPTPPNPDSPPAAHLAPVGQRLGLSEPQPAPAPPSCRATEGPSRVPGPVSARGSAPGRISPAYRWTPPFILDPQALRG